MADYKEIVTGQLVDNNGPVGGAEVKVFDKDMLVDDNLGTAITDKDGRFEVAFSWADYKDGPYEDRPDIYLKIRTAGGVSCKSKVYDEMKGTLADDDGPEIYDLGVVAID